MLCNDNDSSFLDVFFINDLWICMDVLMGGVKYSMK